MSANGDLARRDARRTVAIVRLALVGVVAVGEHLASHPHTPPWPFHALTALAGLYGLAGLAATWGPAPRPWLQRLETALDLAFLCGLTYASGGAFSTVRKAFFIVPLAAAVLLRPKAATVWSSLAVVGFLAVALPPPVTAEAQDLGRVLAHVLYLAWAGGAAVLLSAALARRDDRIRRLVRERGRLIAALSDAEDRERRKLAHSLHDGPVQILLAARQDLQDAEDGDLDCLPFARRGLEDAIAQLRDAIFELHPHALEHSGLAAAIQQVADQQARRGGFHVELAVGPGANGPHRELVFTLVREFLTNAAKHAAATNVHVDVERHDGLVLLSVQDDGQGFDEERLREAFTQQHIGLAASTQRVEALGGQMNIDSALGHGTRIRVQLPVDPPRARADFVPPDEGWSGGAAIAWHSQC